MTVIEFSNEERAILVQKITTYVATELGQEIGDFDAGFLLDFVTKEIGPYYYNRGLYDAQALLSKRIDEIGEAIIDLEKPTEFLK
ncbi:MAG: DUF2164 domain-containing protein [Alphaproteobacteria bacterium]|nr:DUF2164 domain-containing protein [Alphaproteobacteria bacterium]